MAFAVRQLRLAPALRSIAKPLNVLWEESISVASISQVIARRTKISPDEAFLTGLLHGIGRLYIMVRAVGKVGYLRRRAVLFGYGRWIGTRRSARRYSRIGDLARPCAKRWAIRGTMIAAARARRTSPDVLIVSVALAVVLREPGPRTVEMDGISSFQHLGLTAQDCATILRHAEHQLGSLHAALGC